MDNPEVFTPEKQAQLDDIKATADEAGYVRIGAFSNGFCGQQSQYLSRYMYQNDMSPFLAEGLSVIGKASNYHSFMIKADDLETFISRYRAHQRERGLFL